MNNIPTGLRDYAISNRKRGSTEVLKAGINNYNKPFLIIADELHTARQIAEDSGNSNAIPVSIWNVPAGLSLPYVLDNSAIVMLDKENDNYISRLKINLKMRDTETYDKIRQKGTMSENITDIVMVGGTIQPKYPDYAKSHSIYIGDKDDSGEHIRIDKITGEIFDEDGKPLQCHPKIAEYIIKGFDIIEESFRNNQ